MTCTCIIIQIEALKLQTFGCRQNFDHCRASPTIQVSHVYYVDRNLINFERFPEQQLLQKLVELVENKCLPYGLISDAWEMLIKYKKEVRFC